MKTTENLSLCNCFAARQAARFITKTYEHYLAQVQLTSTQFSVLVMLAEAPNLTMREMGDMLVMDRTSLVRALKPLQREEWVVSQPDAVDPRKKLFALSEQGQQKLAQASPLWLQAQQEFEAKIGKENADHLRDISLAIGQ